MIGNFKLCNICVVWIFVIHLNPIFGQSDLLNQTLTVQFTDNTLDQSFDKLSALCNCYFTYNATEIDGNKRVTGKFKNVTLKSVLHTIIQNPEIQFEAINNQMVLYKKKLLYTTTPEDLNNTQKFELFGFVTDSLTKKPLPFATVAIKGKQLGTIANLAGRFQMNLPRQFISDTLVISYLGYGNKQFPVAHFINQQQVFLCPDIISLQEVVVRSTDPLSIIRKARKKIAENYYTRAYNFKAFYRESVKRNSRIMLYAEALLSGYKPSIDKVQSVAKAEVLKGRRFDDIHITDTLLIKLKGGVETCFQLDLINQVPDFLNESSEQIYDYFLTDIITWQNELVYVIGFKGKPHADEAFFTGEVYITILNSAILGAKFSFTKDYLRKNNQVFVSRQSRAFKVNPQNTVYEVHYYPWQGKYFVHHVRGELLLRVRKRNKILGDNYQVLMEMVYTDRNLDHPKKPTRRNMLNTHSIFSESNQVYNASFWEKENVILPETNILEAFKKSGFKTENQQTEK